MKKISVKKQYILVLALILCFVSTLQVYAANNNEATADVCEMMNTVVKQWINNNYGQFYYINNIDITIERTMNSEKDVVKQKLLITFEKMLKAVSVEQLPYVQGLRQVITINDYSEKDVTYINTYVTSLNEYIGIYTDTCIDIIAEYQYINGASLVTLYFQDIMTGTVYPISVLNLNSSEMTTSGYNSFDDIVAYECTATSIENIDGYSSYIRTDARDYAKTYTSNDISVCSCSAGANCTSAKYNTSYWNSNYSVYSHNDCCNYASQSMAAGNLPVNTTWYKDSYAWINSTGLKNYMIGAGYWDTSTFAVANAGNILRWKDSASNSARHTVLITLNDTVTHQFCAHTTDRLNCVFYNSSDYEYYTIKTNP